VCVLGGTQCFGEFVFVGNQPGPLRHPPPPAAVHPLPPMPPVLLPNTLLAPPAPGVPLIAPGTSMIPPLPAAPGPNLLPAGVLLDPKYCMLLCFILAILLNYLFGNWFLWYCVNSRK